MGDHCCSTQLIDGNGDFNVAGLDNFVRTTKLADCGLSYAVVAIMGPQSSGMFVYHSIRSALISSVNDLFAAAVYREEYFDESSFRD